MRDGGYPDDIRSYDSDPASPFYHVEPGAQDRADLEEETQEAVDCIEAYAGWLAEVADFFPDEADEAQMQLAVAVDLALHKALAPFQTLILQHARDQRAKQAIAGFGPRRPLRLFGATLEARS